MTLSQPCYVLCGTILLAICLFNNSAYGHPFHTTTAEMEFNSSAGRFEVSLKIPAADFEYMVQAGTALIEAEHKQAKSDANQTAQIRKLDREQRAARYIEKQFAVTLAGEPCRFEWVGVEDELTSKWLYFELILPGQRPRNGECTLSNKVLCDHNLGQINTVVVISRTARVSVKTHENSTNVSLPRID